MRRYVDPVYQRLYRHGSGTKKWMDPYSKSSSPPVNTTPFDLPTSMDGQTSEIIYSPTVCKLALPVLPATTTEISSRKLANFVLFSLSRVCRAQWRGKTADGRHRRHDRVRSGQVPEDKDAYDLSVGR